MKRIVIMMIIWACVLSAVPWWVIDNHATGGGRKFRGVCVLSDAEVWVVGEQGNVWKRTGGLHSHEWAPMPGNITNPSQYHFNDVCFVSSSYGWIVGEKNSGSSNIGEGVVFKTTDGGASWQLPTNIPSFPIPTPFLKVRMILFGVDYQGYISCGNGVILRTTNGGVSWSRTQSNPVSDSLFNIQNYYDGLWVDSIDANRLQVTGDAFGVVARSTDGGVSWTSQSPDSFIKAYNFPPYTGAPYGTRLAVMDMDCRDADQGAIGLSCGRIGRTYNGGQTWYVQNWADSAIWFTGLTYGPDSALYGTGTHHIIQRNSTMEHNLHSEFVSIPEPPPVPLIASDFSTGNIGYAVGSAPNTYYGNILQRYDPVSDIEVGWQVDTITDSITVTWRDNREENLREWRASITARIPFVSNSNDYTTPAYGANYLYSFGKDIGYPYPSYWYLTIKAYTNDYESSFWANCQIFGPYEIQVPNGDTTYLPAPDQVVATDISGDEGGRIWIRWDSVPGATGYNVARAENPAGP